MLFLLCKLFLFFLPAKREPISDEGAEYDLLERSSLACFRDRPPVCSKRTKMYHCGNKPGSHRTDQVYDHASHALRQAFVLCRRAISQVEGWKGKNMHCYD